MNKKNNLSPGTPSPSSALPHHHENPTRLGSNQKGWYTRGYLPHLDCEGICQFITFRLADSLPQSKLRELNTLLRIIPKQEREGARRQKIEEYLDKGMGCCALRHPTMASVVIDTLQRFDGKRYRLIAWCIMPNHVHVLIEAYEQLPRIVQSWKSYTGRWALAKNAELGLGVPGKQFWMRDYDYWDRYIRNDGHLLQVVDYIHGNPVNAGLCRDQRDWSWSSAHSLVK